MGDKARLDICEGEWIEVEERLVAGDQYAIHAMVYEQNKRDCCPTCGRVYVPKIAAHINIGIPKSERLPITEGLAKVLAAMYTVGKEGGRIREGRK